MNADQRLTQYLQDHGLELPAPPKVLGLYKPALLIDRHCFLSGHLPLKPDGGLIQGKIGHEIDESAGYEAARQCGLAMLATLKQTLQSLDRVERVVKLLGMVNCTDQFTQQPAVVNGCSELMKAIFGDDQGVGTRSAVGVGSLPMGVSVEIEGLFLLKQ